MKEVVDTASDKQNSITPDKTEIKILSQYIKELSFTNPLAPEIFSKLTEPPQVDLDLDIQVKDISSNTYEVTIATKAKAKKNLETVFSVDIKYSGVFEIKDANEEQKKQILLIYCPNLLFPFLRSVVAAITREAGYQPLMLTPVDFASLYTQQNTGQSKQTAH